MTYPTEAVAKLTKLNREVHGEDGPLVLDAKVCTYYRPEAVTNDDQDVTCPFCLRTHKNKSGSLVRHGWHEVGGGAGYGRGWQTGPCIGWRDVCLDVSDEAGIKHVGSWQKVIDGLGLDIADAEANKVKGYRTEVFVPNLEGARGLTENDAFEALLRRDRGTRLDIAEKVGVTFKVTSERNKYFPQRRDFTVNATVPAGYGGDDAYGFKIPSYKKLRDTHVAQLKTKLELATQYKKALEDAIVYFRAGGTTAQREKAAAEAAERRKNPPVVEQLATAWGVGTYGKGKGKIQWQGQNLKTDDLIEALRQVGWKVDEVLTTKAETGIKRFPKFNHNPITGREKADAQAFADSVEGRPDVLVRGQTFRVADAPSPTSRIHHGQHDVAWVVTFKDYRVVATVTAFPPGAKKGRAIPAGKKDKFLEWAHGHGLQDAAQAALDENPAAEEMRELGRSNAFCALDQVEAHDSLEAAIDAYRQNVIDLAVPEGMTWKEATDIAEAAFDEVLAEHLK